MSEQYIKKTDSEAECKCAHCVLNTCKPYWNGDIGYYEPFEFNVGDYVELKDGSVGYIEYIQEEKAGQMIGNEILVHILSVPNNITRKPKYSYYINCGHDFEDILNKFKRIGKYDFTEPKQFEQSEVKKIDKLSYSSDWVEIRDKINEVIDRVNEIGEK